MKRFERITLVAVATAYSGYLIHHAARVRADERCCRLAAGESVYERTHLKLHRGRSLNGHPVTAGRSSRAWMQPAGQGCEK